jgi:hypothetical protein
MAEIAGLKLIVPTSVAGSGVSVSSSGKVTFTSTGAISINGCFTSTYDNYLIVLSASSAADVVAEFRLRLSGSDASALDYTIQYLQANGSTVDGFRAADNEGISGYLGTSTNGTHMYLYGPALAQPTVSRVVNVASTSGARFMDAVTTHSLSTSYDGITFLSSQNLTGSLTIYGLSQ